jgi:hypothetical protein
MSSQLPYLPPLDRFRKDVAAIAKGTAEDVQAAQGTAAKAGLAVRGALAGGAAVARATGSLYDMPGAAVRNQVIPFVQNLFGGPQPAQPVAAPAPAAPTLNLPALATPAPAASAAPATQAPVVPAGGLTASRQGNNVTVSGDAPAPAPPVPGLPTLRVSPVSVGISQQAQYAEQQRQAVMAAAAQAAAAGNPDNASYRYAAALNALPHLSGANNFAQSQVHLTTELEAAAERDRSNQRTVGATENATKLRAQELRRNVQPTVIGEEINPDASTRFFAPTIKRYGFVTMDEKGKVEVRDMQGNLQKPAAPPISREEFITKNKAANPGMSEGDIGREYDKKYGGKS